MDDDWQQELEALYRQVVDLGDRARGWFDGPGQAFRAALPIEAQAEVAVESLGTTARLLAVMSWLLDPLHETGTCPAFAVEDSLPELPAGSPLAGTPGGEIARASRRLVGEARALAAGGAST